MPVSTRQRQTGRILSAQHPAHRILQFPDVTFLLNQRCRLTGETLLHALLRIAVDDKRDVGDAISELLNDSGILGKILLLQMRFPNFYKKLSRDNELLSDITKQINDGSSPDLSPFCMNEEEKHSLYNFLYETRDIYHTPKFVSECITLTLLTS